MMLSWIWSSEWNGNIIWTGQLQNCKIGYLQVWPSAATHAWTPGHMHVTYMSDSQLLHAWTLGHMHVTCLTLSLVPELCVTCMSHDTSPAGLTLSCYMPGLLVTASVDDTIKFWDIHVCSNNTMQNAHRLAKTTHWSVVEVVTMVKMATPSYICVIECLGALHPLLASWFWLGLSVGVVIVEALNADMFGTNEEVS